MSYPNPIQTLQQQAPSVHAKIKQAINQDLKETCRREGLAVSGVKATLQSRIITLLDTCVRTGDVDRFNRIRYRIYNHGADPPPAGVAGSDSAPFNLVPSNALAPGPPPPPYAMPPNGYRPGQAQGRPAPAPALSVPTYGIRFSFKDSPFYEPIRSLMPPMDLAAIPHHRSTTQGTLSLPAVTVDQLRSDKSLRIMLYSAQDPPLGPYARADIAFPAQIEVKINGDELKANFKGLKNKPGSTRPADITEYIRKTADYKNNISVTYALTSKDAKVTQEQKYVFVVYLARKYSVEELVGRIQRGRVITKQTVLNEMRTKANDPDIVATSIVMSLKDPLVMSRISLPCRSAVCTHNQCFDATAFLQLQEQAPTWSCPICNKTVSFEGLAVDQYVQEILQQTSRSTDQVTIEPDGKWTTSASVNGTAIANPSKPRPHDPDSDDDDIVEVSDYRLNNIKAEAAATNTPVSLARTPPMSSREPSMVASSSAAPPSRSGGAKRTQDVVDLTLSDDEDDEPVRPNKRVAYSTPNSNPDAGVRNGSFGGQRQPQPQPHPQPHPPPILPSNLAPSTLAPPTGSGIGFRIPNPQSPQNPPVNLGLGIGMQQPQQLQRTSSRDLLHQGYPNYGSPP